MTAKQLRRILQSFVITAPAATWLACGHSTTTSTEEDAGTDASVQDAGTDAFDAADTAPTIDDTEDATVYWCDAGPPVNVRTSLCYNYFYVPCGLPPLTFLADAATDPEAGPLNRCDQVCAKVQHFDCALLDRTGVEDSKVDAAPEEAAQLDGGGSANPNAVYVVCGCSAIGRRPRGLRQPRAKKATPLAEHFAKMAYLEAASVPAFLRLHEELRALSAPPALLRSVARASRDEERHARVVGRIARRFGAAVATPRVRRFRSRSAVATAVENATEGCVREAFGAALALWQAEHASDGAIRKAMTRIAKDEIGHAAVSFRVARFLETHLSERERARVNAARGRAIARLREEVRVKPPGDIVSVAGMPDAARAMLLLARVQETLWAASAD